MNLLSRKRTWWVKDFPKTAPPKPKHPKFGVPIGISDVIGYDDEHGIDISELSDQRVIVEERPMIYSEGYIPESAEPKEKSSSKQRIDRNPTIALKQWNPDMPYMKELNAASDDKLYDVYHSIRSQYKDMPSFYVDASIVMQDRGLKDKALLVISNLAEIKLEDYRLLRVLAHRLLHTNHTGHAIFQLEVVKRLRPEEPQSFRDLALAYDQHKEYQKALDSFMDVIETPFDRFQDIKLYATEEMNNMIERTKKENIRLNISRIDSRLLENMPVDIRVMMSWDTDNTDIDLWVIDPHDQQCYYGKRETYNGGMYFSDFTGGYGPETYQIREAIKGKYKIVAKYYANHSESITGPTTIYLDIFTEYATENEKKESVIVRLDYAKDELDIGEIKY